MAKLGTRKQDVHLPAARGSCRGGRRSELEYWGCWDLCPPTPCQDLTSGLLREDNPSVPVVHHTFLPLLVVTQLCSETSPSPPTTCTRAQQDTGRKLLKKKKNKKKRHLFIWRRTRMKPCTRAGKNNSFWESPLSFHHVGESCRSKADHQAWWQAQLWTRPQHWEGFKV